MRVAAQGKSRTPTKCKNTAETFTFKAAVLASYDTQSMPAVVAMFWPGIALRSPAYTTKKRVVLRWRQHRSNNDSMAARLAEILESLSCGDSVVGEVAWDDDVVGRYL
ncbi:hypothetical protein JG688_00001102 [Phytophthora aleatoria]|uniref:Uncharacterized protein n=1 Tax=Phytophthora aleatoria TaxID=2496075 RepID=A0A8J5IY31_9STRA|nr:hypothetical protein JG688_00001102 [Phytophthora aleatoria]